jgi:hypothetical protein
MVGDMALLSWLCETDSWRLCSFTFVQVQSFLRSTWLKYGFEVVFIHKLKPLHLVFIRLHIDECLLGNRWFHQHTSTHCSCLGRFVASGWLP